MRGPRYNPVLHADAPTADVELADMHHVVTAVVLEEGGQRSEEHVGDDDLRVLDNKGRTIKLKVDLATLTIRQLKGIISRKAQVSEHLQRLIYSGKELRDGSDGDTLARAGVKAGTVVHLFQRPQNSADGGSTPATANAVSHATTSATAVTVNSPMHAEAVSVVVPGSLGRGQVLMSPEIEMGRRRVKFLASILLLISTLNLVTLVVYLGDALLGEPMDSAQWLSLIFELAVNCAGVGVGLAGLKGAATLDYDEVKRYTAGVLCVGAMYISADILSLVRVSMQAKDVGPDPAMPTGGHHPLGPENSRSDDDEGDPGGTKDEDESANGDQVSMAVTSLLLTLLVWGMCFSRAAQFLQQLDDARGGNEASNVAVATAERRRGRGSEGGHLTIAEGAV